MTGTPTIACPKCRGEMITYERNGVQIDQCECSGIFLDRGELEQLIEAATKSIGVTHPADVHKHSREHRDRSHQRRRTGATNLPSEFLAGGE
jgi:Zn-finger nucleic acid-binding protein